jgi:hypothetical protein
MSIANSLNYQTVVINLVNKIKEEEESWNFGKPSGMDQETWEYELIQEDDEDSEEK